MVFMLLGVLLLALKLAEINPVADWSWFTVLAPFAMAVAWWAFSDATGRTKRVGMQKGGSAQAGAAPQPGPGMGLQGLFDRSVAAKLRRADASDKTTRQRQIDNVETERERKRQANRDSILTTRMDSQFDSQSAPAAKPDKP